MTSEVSLLPNNGNPWITLLPNSLLCDRRSHCWATMGTLGSRFCPTVYSNVIGDPIVGQQWEPLDHVVAQQFTLWSEIPSLGNNGKP
jgi:hypothetical protein